jgi:hypothetical protein
MTLVACEDCKKSVCDCWEQIWSFRVRYEATKQELWAYDAPMVRDTAVRKRDAPTYSTSVEFGPVQRMTDPPHVFESKMNAQGGFEDPPVQARKVKSRQRPETKVDFQKVDSNRITVTQPELARLLFDGSRSVRRCALEHAEIDPKPNLNLNDAAKARLNRVLDIMWDKMHPEDRALAERRAAAVFARAKETDPVKTEQEKEFDPDFSPDHEINKEAAKAHGLRYDRRRRAYVDEDGCSTRDKFGRPLG